MNSDAATDFRPPCRKARKAFSLGKAVACTGLTGNRFSEDFAMTIAEVSQLVTFPHRIAVLISGVRDITMN